MIKEEENWNLIISSNKKYFNFNFKQVWIYKDLLFLLVRRDFVSFYKQTILGPLWFLIQPLFTIMTYTIVFSKLAGISTDGLPPALFYMVGIANWSYFSESLIKTSTVFRDNVSIFGKVYFPRVVMPISIVISSLIKFAVQLFLLFLIIFFYYFTGSGFFLTWYILFLPLIVLLMAAQALGLGMIISAMTIKYRDLSFLVSFGIQLLMYATPVIFPLSTVPQSYKWLISLNPMTQIIETARLGILGSGSFIEINFLYTIIISIIILLVGILVFNKVEKTFIDTV